MADIGAWNHRELVFHETVKYLWSCINRHTLAKQVATAQGYLSVWASRCNLSLLRYPCGESKTFQKPGLSYCLQLSEMLLPLVIQRCRFITLTTLYLFTIVERCVGSLKGWKQNGRVWVQLHKGLSWNRVGFFSVLVNIGQGQWCPTILALVSFPSCSRNGLAASVSSNWLWM